MVDKSVCLVILLLSVAVFVYSKPGPCKPGKCNKDYCVEYKERYLCPEVLCIIGRIPMKKPELCRCCDGCYKPVGKFFTFLLNSF